MVFKHPYAAEFVQISTNNVRCLHFLQQLQQQRQYEIDNYTAHGSQLFEMHDELNTLLKGSLNVTDTSRDRIREITAILQTLPSLLKPDVSEPDLEIELNYLKIKENEKATSVHMSWTALKDFN